MLSACSFMELHAAHPNIANMMLHTPGAGLPCLEKAITIAQVILISLLITHVNSVCSNIVASSNLWRYEG